MHDSVPSSTARAVQAANGRLGGGFEFVFNGTVPKGSLFVSGSDHMKTHQLDLVSPKPAQMLVTGVGIVHGSAAYQIPSESYLVEVTIPLDIAGVEIHQLLLNPRLAKSTLQQVINGSCSVNVSYLKPATRLKAGDEYGGFDFEYWTIGFITPVNDH